MSRKIADVIVDKISLVTKDELPAVEKAETKYSIFKSFRFFKKSNGNLERLDKIKEILDKKVNDLENVWDSQ